MKFVQTVSEFSFVIYICYVETIFMGTDWWGFLWPFISMMYIHYDADAILACGGMNGRFALVTDRMQYLKLIKTDDIPERKFFDNVKYGHYKSWVYKWCQVVCFKWSSNLCGRQITHTYVLLVEAPLLWSTILHVSPSWCVRSQYDVSGRYHDFFYERPSSFCPYCGSL